MLSAIGSTKRRRKYYVLLSFAALVSIFLYLFLTDEMVEVSNIQWKRNNGSYLVTFSAENKTRGQVSEKISVKMYTRKFAAGSPKAEILDLVADKTLEVDFRPEETKEIKVSINPKQIVSRVDMVTINPWKSE